MKEGFVLKSESTAAAEMEKINRYTRREYQPEEVYTFSLVLCDNEIDRDWERFSTEALEKLKELFLGKTCILDHERKSANQTARIYDTAVEREEGRVTRAGEPYARLTAKAYLPRTEKTRETIELIDSGILKEVSVSCAVKRSVCGICGKEQCGHRKGQTYAGKLCSRVLQEPTDAYECSFVAVPAQREAGVRKGWQAEEIRLLGADETQRLQAELEELREKAKAGEEYRRKLAADVLCWARITQPELPQAVLKSALEKLTLDELSQLGEAWEELAAKKLPLHPQTAARREEQGKIPGNGVYQI